MREYPTCSIKDHSVGPHLRVCVCYYRCALLIRGADCALERLPGSDERKVAIVESTHRNTTVSQGRIAERLRMKSAANVSQRLGRKRKPERASMR